MHILIGIIVSLLFSVPALAQFSGAGGISQTQLDSAVAGAVAQIPQFATDVPPQPLGTGTAGAAATMARSDAAGRLVFQGTNVVTDAGGNWSVTWGTTYQSSQPLVIAKAIVPSSFNSISCEVSTRSATSATGWCRQSSPTLLNLSIVTTGLTLNPFANIPATGTSVMVFSREPTQ